MQKPGARRTVASDRVGAEPARPGGAGDMFDFGRFGHRTDDRSVDALRAEPDRKHN